MGDLRAYLSWLAVDRQRSANTVAAYRRDLESYLRHLGEAGIDPSAATDEVVERYLESLRGAGRRPASVARALVSIRSFHRFCGTDAADAIGAPAVPARQVDVLRPDEVRRLLASVQGDGPIALRDRALLELLWATGARVSEAVGLDLADLRAEDGQVELAGPSGERRRVPLTADAQAAVTAWLQPGGRPWLVRRGERALLVNAQGGRLSRQGAWGIVRHLGDEAGFDGRLRPQVLRRSFAARLLAEGVAPAEVSALLGQRGPLLGYP